VLDAHCRVARRNARCCDGGRVTVPVNFPALLEQIICPALLITAEPERGAILTDEDVADLQKSVPHLKREHIPGAGHSIRREQFSRYMEVVDAFLNEIWICSQNTETRCRVPPGRLYDESIVARTSDHRPLSRGKRPPRRTS
jgi:hypothetical protein